MRIVNMDHKISAKGKPSVNHGIEGKTSLLKKTERGLKKAGRAIGGIAAAADKALDRVDNDVVQLAHKSLRISSDAVKLGGKTVKVAAKSVVKTIKLSKTAVRKIKLAKMNGKQTFKVGTSKLYKVTNAASITQKHVLKPAAKAAESGVKIGASAVGTVVDKTAQALGNVDNDTVQFAKKTYDVANAAGAVAEKAGKVSVKALKTTRTLATKKGRRRLVKSVKRKAANIKRNIRRVQKAAKFAAKTITKAAKLAVKALMKIGHFLIATAPWSFIVIGIAALLVVSANLVTAIAGGDEEDAEAGLTNTNTVGGTTTFALRSAAADDTDIYGNLTEFEGLLAEIGKEKITDPLKSAVSDFCKDDEEETESEAVSDETSGANSGEDTDEKSSKIIEFNGSAYFPAEEKADAVNALIAECAENCLSEDGYVSFLAVLKILTERKNGERPQAVFTKSDFEAFIGTVNGNTCTYGDTVAAFIIKNTAVTTGETCPGKNCTTVYRDDGCGGTRTNEDGEPEKYCKGHTYCPHDHEKLTITFKSVEDYYSKSVSEIYGFDEDEEYRYEVFVEYIGLWLDERDEAEQIESAAEPDAPAVPTSADGGVSVGGEYAPSEFNVSIRDQGLLIVLVLSLIVGGILFGKKKGG